MRVELESVRFAYGSVTILDRFSAQFPSMKVTVLLGPSGCGKTTILNLLAGLLTPQAGSVRVGDKPPTDIRVGYMFQDVRLIPWLTVKRNLDLILPQRLPLEARLDRIRSVLRLVGLEQALSLFPDQLSGGMYRRVGMARAYLYEPDLYLMDESFQGLDPPLKFQLLSMFQQLRSNSPKTTIFVTHDIEEALLVGDEILLLSPIPTRIVHTLRNPVPIEDRVPGNQEIARLEGELFTLFRKEQLQLGEERV
ncbi:MAG: ABC transporter ATP-binding protein [Spirochaetes bacterium]|nr:ABC transporter ATP-binding protein [Spirochaetota bacterium]